MKIISIAAVTAGGKTTIVNEIKKQVKNVMALHFDDYAFEGEVDDFYGWVKNGANYNVWNLSPLINDICKIKEKSECDYLILDYPDATIKELIQYCAEMMTGHRIKLFYLYASFLPMYALGILSLGIGLLFVEPYVNVTIAQFYLDVFFIEASGDEVPNESNVVRENICD